ncbi:MAG: hypothetical protein EOO70_02600 [Myxococcaceae bacterium]|nr:MAG: hypothetical protein EOO70_02600 [Myxococcaceae bacterium]
MSRDDTDLMAAISRTQARIRELESLVGMLAVRHGNDVGLGTWQLRMGEAEAFELRSQLPARDLAVIVTYEEDGDFVISVI